LQKIKDLWPFLGVIAGYVLLRQYLGVFKTFHPGNSYVLILGFVTFLRSVITDLRLFIFPVDLHFDRCLPFFLSLTRPEALATLAFWALAVAALAVFRRKTPPFVLFLMGWFALELLPVSQLITSIGVGAGRVSSAEHFLYLAAIPVFIGIVMALGRAYEMNLRRPLIRPVLFKCLIAGFLAFLLLTAVEQSFYAVSEFGMLQRSLAFEPNNPRVQGTMGLWYVFKDDIADAEKHFRAAALAEPFNPMYHISLGTALCQEGHWIEGLAQLVVLDSDKDRVMVERQEKLTMTHIRQQLSQGKTFDAKGWMTLGIYYAKIGLITQAIDAFVKSAALNPGLADVWFNLGSLYEAQQNWPAARAAYEKLMALESLSRDQQGSISRHLIAIGKR
jgi:tetratricopeptide (TPR) repeat protein